jgi:hypothetical protein
MSATNGRIQRSPEDRYEDKQRDREHDKATTVASEAAASTATDLLDGDDADLAEFLSKPDIDRDDDAVPDGQQADLEELLSPWFGRHLAFGNIDRKKAEKEEHYDRARALLVGSMFKRPNGVGSKCSTEDRRIANGGEVVDRPALSPDRKLQLMAGFEERSNARRLAINGKLLDAIRSVIAEARNRSIDSDDGSGWVNKLTGGVFGS